MASGEDWGVISADAGVSVGGGEFLRAAEIVSRVGREVSSVGESGMRASRSGFKVAVMSKGFDLYFFEAGITNVEGYFRQRCCCYCSNTLLLQLKPIALRCFSMTGISEQEKLWRGAVGFGQIDIGELMGQFGV